jgi:ATP-dependent Clp endopeptidase proteolytic subunit ClpP
MRKSTKALTMRAPKQPQGDASWFAFRNVSDDEAEIDIYGEIGGYSWWDDDENVTASSFRKKLKELKGKSRITVHVNSPGGSVFEGLAIYNALKQSDSEIKVVVDALAASAASFIAMAASPGQLIMARNAVMMIHDAATYAAGNADDMREMADLLDMHSDNIADIYSQRSGETVEFWREAMKAETWYTGSEAVDAGLADGMLEDEDEEAEKVAAKFDLSVYNYAGREQAPAPSVVHKRIKSMMNQAKEKTVPKPVKNHDETTGEETAGATGDGQPVVEENPQTTQPVTEEEQTEEQPSTDAAPEATLTNRAGMVGIVVNGVTHQVPAVVAQRITALETAQMEQRDAARRSFVASLASSNKITSAQVSDLEEFALDLSDKQYEKWVGSWNVAAPLSLLGNHGQTGTQQGAGQTVDTTASDEMKTLEEIVAHNRNGGMSQAQLEKTPSYIKLQSLKTKS